jgi:hypothetical protein
MTLGCLLFVPASSSGQFPTFPAALLVPAICYAGIGGFGIFARRPRAAADATRV